MSATNLETLDKAVQTEMKTVSCMIRIYCADHHEGKPLCALCQNLHDYAHHRLQHCRFQAEKPTCGKCPIHCYKPEMKEKIKTVMRYAGPKMAYRHPWLAFIHLWKERFGPNPSN